MSEEKKGPITEKKVSRRSMLKWTAGLAAAGAIGIGVGYGADEILRSTGVIPPQVITETVVTTVVRPAESTYVSAIGPSPSAVRVTVANGRIIRIEPLAYPEFQGGWTLKVGDHSFTSPLASLSRNHALGYRRVVYNPNRIGYPMKRVSYTLGKGGENSADRAKGEFVRITWDEALTTIGNEIKRVIAKYGNSALYAWSPSHHEYGSLHYTKNIFRLFDIAGGYTAKQSADHSWVGYQYGSLLTWGYDTGGPTDDIGWDILQNSKMIVYWGIDQLLTGAMYEEILPWAQWAKELGIKQVFITPDLNWSARAFADTWISPYPGTDNAMAAAIAYTWIQNGTLDQNFLDTHTIGFDETHLPTGAPPNSSFKSYIVGTQDGVPKTPEWAEKICGVPARIIRALAKEWASKPTNLQRYTSQINREAYGYEWCMMTVTLAAMQGFGKPGVSIATWTGPHDPRQIANYVGPMHSFCVDAIAKKRSTNPVQQVLQYMICDDLLLKASPAAPISWTGGMKLNMGDYDKPWLKFTYPMPGNSEVHLWYNQGGSNLHVPPQSERFIPCYLSPKIEFLTYQGFRWDTQAKYADIILPACTGLERSDMIEVGNLNKIEIHTGGGPAGGPIAPLFESKSDLTIYAELAKVLGIEQAFTEGNTEADWLKIMFATTNMPITYEDFKAKGYYVWPLPADFKPNTAWSWYYNKAQSDIMKPGQGLVTPTGLIEIFSTTVFKHEGISNPEIPPIPKYIPSWEGIGSPLAQKYPLQLETPHPKFRFHSQFFENTWFRELFKVVGPDGKEYEPMYIHPTDAQARSIKDGDIVRVFNDRGQILCGARITERVKPATVAISYGEPATPTNPADLTSLETSGCANWLMSKRPQSTYAMIVAYSALVQVEKWVK